MPANNKIYDQKFFRNTIRFESPSAKSVVNILMKYFRPQSVVDIGCGAGIYLKEFVRHGAEITGYDGSPAALKESLIGDKIKLHDLSKPLDLAGRFDLCLCIEVAEHLEQKYSKILISTLAGLSPVIVFTAATPGQGPKSIGHINEQFHKFWIKLFKKQHFTFEQKLTEKIKKEMKARDVVWWVTKNLMIFKKNHEK